MIKIGNIYHIIIFVSFVYMVGCKNTRNDKGVSKAKNESLATKHNLLEGNEEKKKVCNMFDIQFFQLPQKRITYPYIAGGHDDIWFFPVISKANKYRLSLIGEELLVKNSLIKHPQFEHYLVDQEGEIIGYSFLPPDRHRPKSNNNSESASFEPKLARAFNRSLVVSPNPQDHGKVFSLKNLKEIKTIEFIEFGVEEVSSNVWLDLSVMAKSGSLTGLSIFRGDSFFDVRGGVVLNEIRGVVVYLENIENLEKLASAFPNLEFLCLVVRDRSKLEEMIWKGYLKQYFHHLRALMIGDIFWHSSEFDSLVEGRETSKRLKINPTRIQDSLTWLGIDGALLSLDDMVAYDRLGKSVNYLRKKSAGKNGSYKKLDTVYWRYGYSLQAARSMSLEEYFELDKLWRRSCTAP